MMMMDPEHINVALTAAGTMGTTVIGITQWYRSTMRQFNSRIELLSLTIQSLDKNLAIQSTILETFIKNCKNCK